MSTLSASPTQLTERVKVATARPRVPVKHAHEYVPDEAGLSCAHVHAIDGRAIECGLPYDHERHDLRTWTIEVVYYLVEAVSQ